MNLPTLPRDIWLIILRFAHLDFARTVSRALAPFRMSLRGCYCLHRTPAGGVKMGAICFACAADRRVIMQAFGRSDGFVWPW